MKWQLPLAAAVAIAFCGLLFADEYRPGANKLALAGVSGDIQTNNGAGNLGALTPGAGVATALANPVNSAGGLSTYVPGRQTIGQVRVPMAIPSSGSMANNGAVTLTTALDQTYPNIYLYMPAGAIAAASTAGYYYATCSSGTACTLFNNPYVSGTPSIPASPTAFATTGPGAYTQTTGSNLTCYSLSIAGNTLGIYDEIQTHGVATYNNNADLKTFVMNYGGFLFASGSPTTTVQTPFQAGFAIAGKTNRQSQTGATNAAMAANTTTPSYGAIDSTAAQNLTFQLKLATATDYIVLQNFVAEHIIAASN